jgi:ParB/RepB/Spo0J family partition protein
MATTFKILTFLVLSISQIETTRFRTRKVCDINISTEFVQSIKLHGVIQPLVVINDKGNYHLISGFRRIQAAKEAKLYSVPCLVVEGKIAKFAGFIENEHHEKFNLIETSECIKMLFNEVGGTQVEFSELIGLTTSTLSDELSICKLDETIKAAERNYPILAKRELIPLSRIKDREEQLNRYNEIKQQKAEKKDKRTKPVNTTRPEVDKAKALTSKIKALSADIIKSYRDIEDSKYKAECDNALIDLNSLSLKILPGMADTYKTKFLAHAVYNIVDTIKSAENKIIDDNERKNIRKSLQTLARAIKTTSFNKSDASDFVNRMIQMLIL